MYGLSDKCPASVDTLSWLLELISSDRLRLGTRPWSRALFYFSQHSTVWRDKSAGWRFQLGSQNSQSHDFISFISNTSKIMASSTTYYISCRDYKLLIFSIKRPKSPRPLTHFIPSPQPARATALPGCLPILASQKPAEIGSSPVTVFHLPLLCDFSVLFTKTYYDCYNIYIKGKLTK